MFAVSLSGLAGEGPQPTVKRDDGSERPRRSPRSRLEAAGVEFIDENGGGRLCKGIVKSHDLQCAVPEKDLNESL